MRVSDFKPTPIFKATLECKLGAALKKTKRYFSKKVVPTQYIIDFEQDVYFSNKPNAVTEAGAYYYSLHDAMHGICELTYEERKEVDSLWGTKFPMCRNGIEIYMDRKIKKQLGVEYSSNNAGDGPPLPPTRQFTYFCIKRPMLLFPVPVQITTHIMECNEKISHQVSLKNDIMICYSCPVQNALAYQQFVDTVNKKLMNVIILWSIIGIKNL
jgi:hypothetical protein